MVFLVCVCLSGVCGEYMCTQAAPAGILGPMKRYSIGSHSSVMSRAASLVCVWRRGFRVSKHQTGTADIGAKGFPALINVGCKRNEM